MAYSGAVTEYRTSPPLTQSELSDLWQGAWGGDAPNYAGEILPRSLGWVCAYEEERLIGFVNIAWDGGPHAFVLDTCVRPAFRRRGIASELVARAAQLARERGAAWLHVDFEPQLEPFYQACGFRPTAAGLINLRGTT